MSYLNVDASLNCNPGLKVSCIELIQFMLPASSAFQKSIKKPQKGISQIFVHPHIEYTKKRNRIFFNITRVSGDVAQLMKDILYPEIVSE